MKNWCKAKTIEICSIDRTWLIEYNQVRLRIRVNELINNEDKYLSMTL